MKTTQVTEVIVNARCPMCNAANELSIPDIKIRVVKCRYCSREFKFVKKYLAEQIKRWRYATR